jgi:hypothetical protein
MPVGTIVGVIQPITSESLSPTTVVGERHEHRPAADPGSWPN